MELICTIIPTKSNKLMKKLVYSSSMRQSAVLLEMRVCVCVCVILTILQRNTAPNEMCISHKMNFYLNVNLCEICQSHAMHNELEHIMLYIYISSEQCLSLYGWLGLDAVNLLLAHINYQRTYTFIRYTCGITQCATQ